ncbi:MAG: hypothetical protein K2F52_00265, partial [Malacoplasma sp.]|nr:hypothetical protein [Malacoplasma sp.]
TLNNLVVFGLDINSGAIVVPKDAKLEQNQVIAKARDNSKFIFFNSSDQLIVTSGSTNANIQNSTKIMSFDESSGFANVKGNDDESNNFGTIAGIASQGDYLLGFLPSGVKGINFSVWLFATANTNALAKTQLSYKSTNSTTNGPEVSINKTGGVTTTSYNYYVFPVNDEFINLKPSDNTSKGFDVANKKNDNTYRGYLNSENKLPNFNSIYKRFFITSSSLNGTTMTESVGVLLDSYDKMFASFSTVPLTINVSNTTFTYGLGNTYMNIAHNQLTGPSAANSLDYDETKKTGLEDDVIVNNWEFNSVGYDKESDFVYFSLSGEEYDYSSTGKGDANGKYLTNTRYIDLKSTTADDQRISSDDYIQENPYTLSDVNFDTYTTDDIYYLAKQVIDGNDGQWLSTTTTNFNNDDENFEPTNNSKINFSSLENLANDIEEKSNILKNMMPSSINSSSLDDFLKQNDWLDTIKFKNVEGNDETGEVSFKTEITYANNFGDGVNDNGKVSYVSYIQATGFAKKDFSWSFKLETESAVTQFRKDYNAKKIVEDNNKGWVIENLLQNITIQGIPVKVTQNMVTLSNPNDTSLSVEINVPIKTSPTDTNGILPVGFPANEAKISKTYNGFTGTGSPNFVPLPDDESNNPNSPNSGDGLSAGVIAGIVIGCLALAAIIIAAVVLIRIRTKAKVSV